MKYTYEAVLTRGEDGWYIEFPQFPGFITAGDTRDEALSRAESVLLLAVADGIEGDGLPEQGHAIECVPVSIEVSQLDIERTHYTTLQDIQDTLEMDESQVQHLIEIGQLETRLFEGEQLVSIESYNACDARKRILEKPEESGRGIDWDW